MSHLALYREWRPQNFDEVVGQTQVVYPLRQAILRGETGHAYLFSGTRGTGKTSLAKIFAKAVNCLEPENGNPCNRCEICRGINDGSLLDVIEMDAASNNSVEDIRRLTDEIVFMPSRAKYKVYIIDEVHMLSSSAFNALLKTLEEPPAHAIFILATTEPQRIPATILSRCQRFEFHRISDQDIAERLRKITDSKGIDISDEAVAQIAKLGDGALRDAISLLDQCQSAVQGRIERSSVLQLSGLVEDDFLYDFCEAFFAADLALLMKKLDEFQMSGKQLGRFVQDFSRFLRDLLILRLAPGAASVLSAANAESQRLRGLSQRVPEAQLFSLIKSLGKLSSELRWSGDPRTALDLLLIREIGETALLAKADPARPDASPVKASEEPVHQAAAEPVEKQDTLPRKAETPPPAEAPIPELPDFGFPQASDRSSAAAPSLSEMEAAPAVPDFPMADEADHSRASATLPLDEAAEREAEESFLDDEDEGEDLPDHAPLPVEEPDNMPGSVEEPEESPAPAEEPGAFSAAEPVSAEPSSFMKETEASGTITPVQQPPAAAGTTSPVHRDAEEEPSEPISEERWQAVLETMRKSGRIDLIMLLAPANVFLSGRHVRVVYPEGLRAHCKNVRRPQNLDVLSRILRENGLRDAELAVELEGEFPEEQVPGPNVNPDEPEWVRKLRESGKKLGLELHIKDKQDETEGQAETSAKAAAREDDPGLPPPPPETLSPLDPGDDELPF